MFQLSKVVDKKTRTEVKDIIAEVVCQRIHKSKDFKLINSEIGVIGKKAGDRVLAYLVRGNKLEQPIELCEECAAKYITKLSDNGGIPI